MYKDILLQKNKDQPRKGHFCVLLVKKIEKHSHLIVRNRKKVKKRQQAYLFTNVFHLVSSITKKNSQTKILRENFLGIASHISYGGKKIKSPKISCFFGHISVANKYILIFFF